MSDPVLGQVPLELTIELGRVTLPLDEVAGKITPGSIIALDKLTGEKLDLRVNGRLVARGEAVAVGERYGVRIVEIVGVEEPTGRSLRSIVDSETKRVERKLIHNALEKCKGNKLRAANELRLSVETLTLKMQEFGITNS